MRVTPEGVFQGIEIGQDILPDWIVQRLHYFGEQLGNEYSQAGYRGYYEVDCVCTKAGKLLMTESIVRRTGGTHVYKVLSQISGGDETPQPFIVSNNTYQIPTSTTPTFSQVYTQLAPILFSPDSKTGVIIASASILKQGKLSYIAVGNSKSHTVEIESQLVTLLKDLQQLQ
jgi:hypothetical protein